MGIVIGIIIIWIIWMLLTKKRRRITNLAKSMAILAIKQGGYIELYGQNDYYENLIRQYFKTPIWHCDITSVNGEYLDCIEFRYKGNEFSLLTLTNGLISKNRLMILSPGTIKHLEKNINIMGIDAPFFGKYD